MQPASLPAATHGSVGGLAVCLTGQLRWHALTLANLKQFVLSRLESSHRLYFVGPAGEHYDSTKRVLRQLGAQPQDICTYDPDLNWVWGPGSMGGPDGPFEMHGETLCRGGILARKVARPRVRKVVFNLRYLPVFRRCIAQRKGGEDKLPLPSGMNAQDKYNITRAQPCPSAVSLIVQLWQARQSLRLVKAGERRLAIRHDAILRIRPDLFFFKPVDLPRPAPDLYNGGWYSMMEESCKIHEGVDESTYGLRHQRFLQDFWLYGSRNVMEVALKEPLERMINFGRDAARFMACATCHARPRSITKEGKFGESCCQRKRKNTPKYALHPVPETLNRTFKESQCLTFNDSYGLLRVNTGESCFMVQARMEKRRASPNQRGLKWRQVDLASGVPDGLQAGGKHDDLSSRFLQGVASVYQRCFGLASNLSCPRTVGDKKLWSGAEAPCLRSLTARCANQDGLVAAAGAGGTGFECAVDGMASQTRLWDPLGRWTGGKTREELDRALT